MCSPKKELQIERSTAYYLGVLRKDFETRVFNDNLIENVNETHFVVNLTNGRTLEFRDNINVKYAEVIFRGDFMSRTYLLEPLRTF